MNEVLELRGKFEQASRRSKFGPPSLPGGAIVTSDRIESLCRDLNELIRYWGKQSIFSNSGALVSAYYVKLAAKSNRMTEFLVEGSKKPNDTIVGAKFSNDVQRKHIITHFVKIGTLEKALEKGQKALRILNEKFDGQINKIKIDRKINVNFKKYGISESAFKKIIVDSYYIYKFDLPKSDFGPKKDALVTLFNTGINTRDILRRIGIRISPDRILNDTTVLLDQDTLKVVMEKAPFLVAMATENLTALAPSDFIDHFDEQTIKIPKPSNEPTVGVIDTLFDKRVYFGEWVDFHDMVGPDVPRDGRDYDHGTAVSSIIVDGPSMNPTLDDGCGRFKVRHFGVAMGGGFNSFSIIRAIKEIIIKNQDIHVWNLSLGSDEEVNDNFISAEGAILDQLQFEYDVIFVIAGTNKKKSEGDKKIGAPADSINSLVVNSVDIENHAAEYSRIGPVLSFFVKPDVSYYGGTAGNCLRVCKPLGESMAIGASFAAPWITRKVAYLIDIIGLSREAAKALIIDSAIGWTNDSDFQSLSVKGHGVVPIRIEDIIKSPNDEIRFVVDGISEKYDTYNYRFPVPVHNDKHPFVVKATLCYFSKCSRSQGVDYTNTEFDFSFGRINNQKLKSINNNNQSDEQSPDYLHEQDARKLFRKWDNVKHISDRSTINRAKRSYENKLWGMSIKTKERLSNHDGQGVHFSVVVTLKEINGENRLEDFVRQCNASGWLVNRINIQNKIDLYQKSEEDITFD